MLQKILYSACLVDTTCTMYSEQSFFFKDDCCCFYYLPTAKRFTGSPDLIFFCLFFGQFQGSTNRHFLYEIFFVNKCSCTCIFNKKLFSLRHLSALLGFDFEGFLSQVLSISFLSYLNS